MSRSSFHRRPPRPHRVRRLAATVLAVAALLVLSACNGDDIASLPEAKGVNSAPTCTGTPSPMTLDYASRSWWEAPGFHNPADADRLVAGWAPTQVTSTVRGYIEFDLSGLSGCATSATLILTSETYASPDPSEDFAVWQVTTPATTLNADFTTTSDPAVYADLADGPLYGVFTVDTSNFGIPIPIPLSPSAVADITASLGGSFVVGLQGTSLAMSAGVDEWLGFGAPPPSFPSQLTVDLIP